jgi:ribose transport system permease protein
MKRTGLILLNNASLILFIGVFAVFGVISERFLEANNLLNILLQSSSFAIVAIGMTYVLLTAGVDLSVGSIMFVAVAVAGKMIGAGVSIGWSVLVILLIGLLAGAVNAFFVTRMRIMAFIVTLAMLYVGRGFGLWLTETRALPMPERFNRLGSLDWLGLPLPIWIFLIVLVAAHVTLQHTPFGRQIYAVGNDREAARKSGLPVLRILFSVYLISGFCAALGGFVSLTQTGAVSPTFGREREFTAIAAAVLGGTSLFGGRGKVFPGTVMGAILIQTVENGLVIINADPYIYPLVTSGIIFLAVLIDSTRVGLLAKLNRRKIRVEPAT